MFNILFRKSICFLLLIFCANYSFGQVKIPETIVFGTVYNIFHDEFDSDEIYHTIVEEDIKKIKEANLNLVMPFPLGQWNSNEKKPDWNRTDFLVNKVEENNLMLMPIMLKSTHRAYLPMWKWVQMEGAIREFPEASHSTEDVKYLHPIVMESIEDYFKSIVDRYGNRTSLVGYNIWNEPHYESFDEINIDRFQKWLKNKYGTLSELNRVWAEDYTEWEQITPLMRRNWESSMGIIDWDLFRYANNGEIAKWCKQTIRKYDKNRFLTVNPVGTVINNQENSQWTVDAKEIVPHTDIFGISFYPDKYVNKHKESMPYWRYSCMYDVTRSDAGDKPYYLVEAQTNQQNGMGLFQFLSYEDIHLMSWIAFADNCKGIVFWKWRPFFRGQQAFGRGLTFYNGELAPRGEAAKEVGRVLKQHGKLLFDAQVDPAEVGILYDIVTLQKSNENLNRPETNNTTDFFVNESFEGTYKALFDNNMSVDIIRTDKSLNLEQLSKYKILFLPYQLVIRPDVANLLKTYVQNGGWIVADARTAIMDQYDFGYPTNPGAGLDEVFSARRLDLYADNRTFKATITNSNFFRGLINKEFNFEGIYFKEKLQILEGSQILAKFNDNDDPAIIVNKYGKGMAVLSAVPLGGSYYNKISSTGNIIQALASMAGVSPTATIESTDKYQIMVKVHKKENNENLAYLINLNENSFNGKISIPIENLKFNKVLEIIENKNMDFTTEDNQLILNISIPAKSTKVIWLK
jgi:beta-galactosidase GanA